MANFPSANELRSEVEIHVSCKGLPSMDLLSKSDPLAVMSEHRNGTWVEVGRTEMLKDNNDPEFTKSFVISYFFESVQPLFFRIYDVDSSSANLANQDFIGEIQINLSEIVCAPGQKVYRDLMKRGHKNGHILLRCEEVQNNNCFLKIEMAGQKLDKMDFFGKSDPYVVFKRVLEDGSWQAVYQTGVQKKTLDPHWPAFEISEQHLCNCDRSRPIQICVYDWDRDSDPDLIGYAQVNVAHLVAGEIRQVEIINPKKQKKKKKYRNSGILNFLSVLEYKKPSFLDYIAGGCEVSMMCAIDYTASNGNPVQAGSLHYCGNTHRPNEYIRAIRSVGGVLGDYDTDQMFPVWGFGAKVPPAYQVSHCFPVNMNFRNPEVCGIQGIEQAYVQSLSQVQLYGPTLFGEIIRAAREVSSQYVTQDHQKYFVLLILTDGIINDMEMTIAEIVNASSLPLSIVIVGVGRADFSNMEVLDADDSPLRSRGRTMERDIVQFVPFNKFQNASPADLAKETLAEIPGQLMSFMLGKGIVPNPKPAAPSAPNQY